MNRIIENLIQNEKFKDYIKDLKSNVTPISILGLVDVAKSQWIDATMQSENRPVCLITYNELQAKKIYEDLQYFNKKGVIHDILLTKVLLSQLSHYQRITRALFTFC